jgi:hypothetical protein
MTDAEIKNLRDLMRAATPGPLTVMARNAGEQCVAVVNQLELVPPNGVELAHEKADADFLAAAVNALPGLLDEVERLRADAARYRWLRGGPDVPPHSRRWSRWEVRYWDRRYWQTMFAEHLDAAIDAAMKEQE